MIQQTSLRAFYFIKRDVDKRQLQVFNFIKSENLPINNRMIAEKLCLPINCVTPRVNELVKLNFVEEKGVLKDKKTNRKTIFWGVKYDV